MISKEAKQRACDLANDERVTSSSASPFISADCMNSPSMMALARQIQQTSDVAKEVRGFIDRNSCNYGAPEAMAAVKSLILPDEPCRHVIDVYAATGGTVLCTKCGTRLKIVQADEKITIKLAMNRDEQMREIRRALDAGKIIRIDDD